MIADDILAAVLVNLNSAALTVSDLVSEVVHCRTHPDGMYCGIHFLPDKHEHAQVHRVAKILRIIVEEQRQRLSDFPAVQMSKIK